MKRHNKHLTGNQTNVEINHTPDPYRTLSKVIQKKRSPLSGTGDVVWSLLNQKHMNEVRALSLISCIDASMCFVHLFHKYKLLDHVEKISSCYFPIDLTLDAMPAIRHLTKISKSRGRHLAKRGNLCHSIHARAHAHCTARIQKKLFFPYLRLWKNRVCKIPINQCDR